MLATPDYDGPTKKKLISQIKQSGPSNRKTPAPDNRQAQIFDKLKNRSMNRKSVPGGRKVKVQPSYKEK